jgi:hypothetical protein
VTEVIVVQIVRTIAVLGTSIEPKTPGRRTMNTKPLPGSLATVTSPATMRAGELAGDG